MLSLALLAANVDPYYIYRNVFARMDALLIGAACACLMREESVVKAPYRYAKWLWPASLGIFGILKLSSNAVGVHVPATQRYGYTLIALGYGSLLLAAILTMGTLFQRFFTSGIMRVFGNIAMGLMFGIGWSRSASRLASGAYISRFPGLSKSP
jgi:hypothetical protein